jgi:hypothetical protein
MQKEFTMTQEDTRLQEARKGTSNVSKWPRYPTIYEINTWVWLSDLSEKSGTSTDLSSVRSADWDAIAKFGFDGERRLCGRSGWPDNPSFQNLVAWSWVNDDDRRLIVVDFSDSAVQAQVQVPWSEVQGKTCLLADAMSDASYGRNGVRCCHQGCTWNWGRGTAIFSSAVVPVRDNQSPLPLAAPEPEPTLKSF